MSVMFCKCSGFCAGKPPLQPVEKPTSFICCRDLLRFLGGTLTIGHNNARNQMFSIEITNNCSNCCQNKTCDCCSCLSSMVADVGNKVLVDSQPKQLLEKRAEV